MGSTLGGMHAMTGYPGLSFAEAMAQQQQQATLRAASGEAQGTDIFYGVHPLQRLHAQIAKEQETKKESFMQYVKEYFVKHRELIMSLVVFTLIDHLIFNGAFREKIEKLVHNLLDKADKKLSHEA